MQHAGAVAWAAGGGVFPMSLQPIPDEGYQGRRNVVAGLIVKIDLDVTTGGGGGCTGAELTGFLRRFMFFMAGRTPVNLTGMEMFWTERLFSEQLASMQQPQAIGAGTANALRTLWFIVPFYRSDAGAESEMNEIPAAALNEARIQVELAPAALNVNTTVNSALVSLYAATDERDHADFPALPLWESADVELFERLPPGIYSHLFLMPPAGGWTAAGLTGLRIYGDEGDVYRGTATDAALAAFRLMRGFPGIVAGANDLSWVANAANMAVLPLIFPEKPYRAARTVPALQGLVLACQGTLPTVRAVWCRWEDAASLAPDLARSMGVSQPQSLLLRPRLQPNTRPPSRLQLRSLPLPLRLVGATQVGVLGRLQQAAGVGVPQAQTAPSLAGQSVRSIAQALSRAGSPVQPNTSGGVAQTSDGAFTVGS